MVIFGWFFCKDEFLSFLNLMKIIYENIKMNKKYSVQIYIKIESYSLYVFEINLEFKINFIFFFLVLEVFIVFVDLLMIYYRFILQKILIFVLSKL